MPSIPTYGNLALFGSLAFVAPQLEDRARQINTYPGVNNLEYLDQGGRGAKSTVEGIWVFSSLAEFQGTLITWGAMVDGVPRILVDSRGMIWPAVLLSPYRLEGMARTNNVTGEIIQRFSGSFLHLSTT